MKAHLNQEESEGYIVEGLMSMRHFAVWQELVNKPTGSAYIPCPGLRSSEEDWAEYEKMRAASADLDEEIVAGNVILKAEHCDDNPTWITSRHFYTNPEAVSLVGIDDEGSQSTMNTAKYWTLRWEEGWKVEYKSRSGESRISFKKVSEFIVFDGVVSPQTLGNLKTVFLKVKAVTI